MQPLEGRVVAVAGAAGSLGPSVAGLLAAQGATLALGERDGAKAERLAGELDLPDERVDACAVDLLDLADARAWAERVAGRFGRADALVHLVGGWRGGAPIAEAPVEDDAWLHDRLVRTVQLATRAFLPALSAAGGRFVLVSSAQARRPSPANAAYAAAKAAAEAWTLALAGELAEHGGTANIVAVKAIVTPAMRAQSPDKEFRTFTDAQDIAAAIAFLLGEAGRKANGQRLALHG